MSQNEELMANPYEVEDRTRLPVSVENESNLLWLQIAKPLAESIKMLPPLYQRMIVEYYGPAGNITRTMSELAEPEGVTPQAIHLRLKRARELLLESLLPRLGVSVELLEDDQTNYGLGPEPHGKRVSITDQVQEYVAKLPAPPPNARQRQQAWLEKIAQKQQRGELTFVKGSLLKRPLPADVKAFIGLPAHEYSSEHMTGPDSPGNRLAQLIARHAVQGC